ncbi:hypothetical protein Bbelb_031800 [Branchiostoma belcheri]|nr:hypothetical protein Bbelb_031800 [Branchiostoma belcheri]
MSSRALRKLRGEQGLPDIVADLGVDISSEEEDVPQPVPTDRKKKPVQNPFDLLVDHDSVEEDVKESQENMEDSHVTEAHPQAESKAGGKRERRRKRRRVVTRKTRDLKRTQKTILMPASER